MEIADQLLFFFSGLGVFNGFLMGLYFLFLLKLKRLQNQLFGLMILMLTIRIGKSVFYYFLEDLSKVILQIGCIRAAQGITVEPTTGRIWFSEHGTIQGDEINLLEAGANYGWPNVTTGKYRSKDYKAEPVPNTNFTDPIHYWLQTVAPTGLTFYTGNTFPEWQGNLIVPGLSRGSLWRIVLADTTVKAAEELFMDEHIRLRKAKMSPDGKLYLLTDEENGRIFEVIR